jgi:hypothetical protein
MVTAGRQGPTGKDTAVNYRGLIRVDGDDVSTAVEATVTITGNYPTNETGLVIFAAVQHDWETDRHVPGHDFG